MSATLQQDKFVLSLTLTQTFLCKRNRKSPANAYLNFICCIYYEHEKIKNSWKNEELKWIIHLKKN